jgi:hypothetical protein
MCVMQQVPRLGMLVAKAKRVEKEQKVEERVVEAARLVAPPRLPSFSPKWLMRSLVTESWPDQPSGLVSRSR